MNEHVTCDLLYLFSFLKHDLSYVKYLVDSTMKSLVIYGNL